MGASPAVGSIPPHRSDAGSFLLAECFGCASLVLVKDVDGLYDRDPEGGSRGEFIREITAAELADETCRRCPSIACMFDLLARPDC